MKDCDKIYYNYLTTYQKDYVTKLIKLQRQKPRLQEFSNPIAEGYRKYLSLVDETKEDGALYLEKFKEKYKQIGDLYYKNPIDRQVILRNKITKGTVTEYQTNYCNIEKDIEYYIEKRTKKHYLPDDVELPQTIYAQFFRDPQKLFGRRFNKPEMIKPKDTLKTKDTFIGHIGSEYSDEIGKLGGIIVKENMIGKNLYDVENAALL